MAIKGAQGIIRMVDKATEPLRNVAKAFKGVGTSSDESNKKIKAFQLNLDGITAAQNRLQRAQAGIKNSTKNIGGEAMGVAALAVSFKAALNPAIKFEQAMKDLEAVAFGAADASVPVAKNMAALQAQAQKLGATTRYSAIQAAEGQIFLAKAGFKTNEIMQAMPALLDLAAASGTDLGRSSDILSDLLGAFGTTAKDTGKLADILAAATSSANVDMETLFETLKVAAPIGIAAGQSIEGITTATALLGNVGIKGSMAGTALKNAFTNLASPAADGAKVLEELGIKVADANGNMRPMQDIMMALGKEAKNLSQVKRIKAFDAVFGKIAMAGAINLEKAVTSGDFEKMLKNLENSQGVAQKMAKIRMDSTEGSLIQVMSAFEGVAIAIGSKVAPALKIFADIVAGLGAPITAFIDNNQTLIKIVGAVAATILIAKVATLAYTATLWLASPALTILTGVLKVAKLAMIGFNLVMAANPIALVVLAVTGLIAAGIALWQNWDEISKAATQIWNDIANAVKQPFIEVFAWLEEKFAWIFDAMGNVKNFVSSKLSSGWDAVTSIFSGDEEQSQSEMPPMMAAQAIQAGGNQTNQANIVVNIADGKVRGVETSGNFRTDTFINNGAQI